jgi:hypothetical protein
MFLLGCCTVQLQAQSRIGLKAGANAATASSALFAENARIGLHVGVFRTDEVFSKLKLRSELLFSQKGWKFTYFEPGAGFLDLRFRLNYLEGVVALHWKIHPKVAVYPGMQLSALVSYNVLVRPGYVQAEYENPSRLEFAPLIGANYQLTKHWSTDLRFNYGTWSIDGWPVSKSAVLMWSVEYRL